MDINININFNHKALKKINLRLTILENIMASLQEIITATRNEQNAVVAAITSMKALIVEVKQALDQNDVAGAQALLDDINANTVALVSAAAENTEIAHLVDQINGDPAVAADPAV